MNQQRVIPWTTRSDLKAVANGSAHELKITIKDEVRNEFFHFGEVEHFILESLRAPTTLECLVDDIDRRFGIKLSVLEIEAYLHRLAQDNLLVARRFGDGGRLFQQANRTQQNRWLQYATGILSIRFRGIYPGNLLKVLSIPGWFLFHPLTVLLVTMATVSTTIFACLNFESVLEKAPTFVAMSDPMVVLLLLIGFVVAKVFHELGHGMACAQIGRECSEMGVMLLVGIPCLYCDVSDVWTEPNRWKRMFVSVAGIYVELIIATLCFWGWYFSVDGNVHAALFGLMMITSINTLFVNGNPLMRYDGYYTLSDALNIPNLAASASEKLQEQIRQIFVTGDSTFNLSQSARSLLIYGFLASLYRVFIMFAIGWAAWSFFEFQQLRAMGTVAVWIVAGLACMPILMSTRGIVGAAWKEGLKLTNTTVFVVLLILTYICLASIQFNYRVRGNGQLQLSGAETIYAPSDGEFLPEVSNGETVSKDTPIARVIDRELELEALVTEGELNEIKIRLESLELANDQNSAGQIAFWEQRKISVQSRLKELKRQRDQLTVVSPRNGVLVAQSLPEVPTTDNELIHISGHRFEECNRGSHVTRGEPLGYIADTNSFRGSMNVSETEIEFVHAGDPVELFIPFAKRTLRGSVISIASESRNESLDDANAESETKTFQVEFECPSDPELRIGSEVKVAIECESISPLGYLGRWWKTTFWF